jgi:uncharacterized Zn-finger protein
MIGGANRWTDFVKKWASDNDTTYGCALSKPECSQAYRAKYGHRKKLSQKKERELMGAEDKDAPAPPEPDYGDDGGDGGDEGPPPPKKKGRPKKYETEAEAKRAKSQKTMEAKKRRDQEKKASKGEAKEAEAMGAEDKDAPVRYLAEIKRLAKQGPSARPRVKELSVVFNSGGMNEKEMDAFEVLAQQFKKPMAPPSGPPPISAEKVAQVKEQMSPARKAQQKRDLMKALRDKRKAEGLSSSGKTLMNPQQMALNKAIVAEGEGIEPIRLEMMEIAEPTVSTKISPNITIAKPRKLKAPKPSKKKTGSGLTGGAGELSQEEVNKLIDDLQDEPKIAYIPHIYEGAKPDTEVVCPICGKMFKYKGLQRHLIAVHHIPAEQQAYIRSPHTTDGNAHGLPKGKGLVGGKKKGFLDFITKVGTTLGKPFEKKVGINPFTAGFDLGEKVIAPALMKVIPPRGGMFEDDEIIEESGPFERAKPTEQELMGREDRRREELAQREADNLFIDDDELVDDDDFFEGDEIIEESGPYERAKPTEREMMGREDARTEELINREADRLFGKGRATGGHWTPPMASHLRKEMRNYQNIARHLGQHLAESGPKDPKDKLGFIHFSKEAKRIRDLIADIV